jgi:hypothetical protein
MATYVNDLRLKEIGTGESSGTWGTETNTNLELIGEALGFGTEAITTNADTHTTTVADGSTDPGRAMYIKYTGTLDSACTITIAPNTMSRMHFIENGTSGSQNIIISQGTGANVTIPAGDVKAVYLDGAGSGAAVADAFASLNVVDLKVEDDLTITDDLTFSSDSAVVTFGADGDTTLTHTDGTGLTLNSTNKLCFNDASQFIQGSSATVLSLGATDEIDLTATAIDVNGTMDVSGSITSSAEMTLTRSDNGINLTLVSTDADANEGPGFVLYRNSSSPADGDVLGQIYFQGENDADQKVSFAYQEARIVDASDGTEDGRIETNVVLAGTAVSRILMDATETVFNDNSKNLDFRVESDGNANMLFVDGGNNRVGIGINDPNSEFEVASAQPNIRLRDTDNNHYARVGGSAGDLILEADGGDGASLSKMSFRVDNADRMELDANGSLELGHGGAAHQRADSQAFSIITPASGGGQGIALKRLDTNTDQGLGEITWSNNTADGLGKMKGKTDGATNSLAITFEVASSGSVSEAMRIDSVGRLLVNTTSVYSDSNDMFVVNGGRSNFTASGISSGAFNRQTSTGDIVAFLYNGSGKGSISTDGSNIAYNTSSDARLKNILGEAKGLDIVTQLNPVNFEWKETGKTQDGLIAQEVEKLIPEAVSTNEHTGFYEMDYSKVVTPLVKAVQELEARITRLEG